MVVAISCVSVHSSSTWPVPSSRTASEMSSDAENAYSSQRHGARQSARHCRYQRAIAAAKPLCGGARAASAPSSASSPVPFLVRRGRPQSSTSAKKRWKAKESAKKPTMIARGSSEQHSSSTGLKRVTLTPLPR